MANQLDPNRLQGTIDHLYAWVLAQAAAGELLEPVDEAEVVAIVNQYEGMVEPEPFELVVAGEPFLVERRKQVVVS